MAKPFPERKLALSAFTGVINAVSESLITLSGLNWVMKGNSAIQSGHTASCTQRASYLNCATFSNVLLVSEGSGYLSSQDSD